MSTFIKLLIENQHVILMDKEDYVLLESMHMQDGLYVGKKYVMLTIDGETCFLHHFLCGHTMSDLQQDRQYIIHKNNNVFDNRRDNLEFITRESFETRLNKKHRKKNAQELPSILENVPIPPYVTYNVEKMKNGKVRDFFRIEGHPNLPPPQKIWCSSKSMKITLLDKLRQVNDKLSFLVVNHDAPKLPNTRLHISQFMKKPPLHIQFLRESEKRGSRFCISRHCSFLPEPRKNIYSTSKKNVSDEDKFRDILQKYNSYTGTIFEFDEEGYLKKED